MSCYVDVAGWDTLERQLARILSSPAYPSPRTGRIALSRTGLIQSRDTALVERLHDFSLKYRDVVSVRVVPDAPGRLFHAKGLGLLLDDGSALVLVGSANLTRAGLESNRELALVRNERSVYDKMVSAADLACERALDIAERNSAAELISALAAQTAPEGPEIRDQEPIWFPDSPPDQQAYEDATRWLSGSLRMARQHQNDEFVVSFPLNKYIDARLIVHGENSDPETGIRIAGDRKSIHIPLLPDVSKEQIRTLNQALGTLLSEYAVEVAGVLWCRPEWLPALHQEWRKLVASVEHDELCDVLRNHIDVLARTIRCEGDRWRSIVRLFQVNPPHAWIPDKASRILGRDEMERLARNPEDATAGVASTILRQASDIVAKHLQIDYLMAQIRMIGAEPHNYPHESRDPWSVFEAILDLYILGVLPHVRAGGQWRPRAHNRLTKELIDRFSAKSAIDAHAQALRFKEIVVQSRGMPEKLPMRDLWRNFTEAFGLAFNPIVWSRVVGSPHERG